MMDKHPVNGDKATPCQEILILTKVYLTKPEILSNQTINGKAVFSEDLGSCIPVLKNDIYRAQKKKKKKSPH
jgi:hypothetical protein